MKFRPLPLLALAAILVTLTACNREYDPTAPYLDEIYPIQDGGSRIYHVTDTSFTTTSSTLYDAQTYFKKEETNGTEEDLLGRTVSKLWIYTSEDTLWAGTEPIYNWNYTELWTQYLDGGFAERIEGNTRYLVLKLPPYAGSTWNGNLYNNLEVQTYAYTNLDTTVTVRGKTYEHCVFVLQVPYRRPVANPGGIFFLEEYAYEIYAPKIGKLVRYFKYYEEQNGDVQSDSRIYYEELVSHSY